MFQTCAELAAQAKAPGPTVLPPSSQPLICISASTARPSPLPLARVSHSRSLPPLSTIIASIACTVCGVAVVAVERWCGVQCKEWLGVCEGSEEREAENTACEAGREEKEWGFPADA